MQPCSKSNSFTFHRNSSANSSSSSNRSAGMENCRRNLQEKFNESARSSEAERSVLSILSWNDNTRKAFRNGAERLTKTFNSVRTSLGTLSQKFKISTKRRQILEEGPMTPGGLTPHSVSRQILGRTPTKMYSPFGIDSPYATSTTYDKENLHPNAVSCRR